MKRGAGKSLSDTADLTEEHDQQQVRTLLRQVTLDLRERTGELRCLYELSQLVDQPSITLQEIMQGTADLLPTACLHPGGIAVRIILDGAEFRSQFFCEAPRRLSADINVRGRPAGRVEVHLLHEQVDASDEKQRLLTAVAGRLGRVAERLQAEASLRRSEQQLRSLVQQSHDGISLVDEQGRIVEWNPAMEQITGLPAQAAIGQLLWDLQAQMASSQAEGPSSDMLQRIIRLAQQTGDAPWLRQVIEREYRHPDGKRRAFHDVVFPIPTEHGVMLGAVSRDVTEHQHAEETLKLNEARLDSLLELSQKADQISEAEIIQYAMQAMVRLTQSEIGYFHFLNPDQNTIQLTTWSNETLKTCRAAYDNHYPLESAGVWADSARLGRPMVHNDYRSLFHKKGYPNGHSDIVRHLGVPVVDEGRVVILCGVGNKATEYTDSDVRQMQLLADAVWRILRRKRADDQIKASLREKEVLLKEVHHRVRNNLQVITSLLSMQSLCVADSAAAEVLQDSRDRVRTMAWVHEQLCQSANLTFIDLADYLRNIACQLASDYSHHAPGVRLHVDAGGLFLDIDTAMLCGLIVNEMVSNALKHAFVRALDEGGQVWVEARLEGDNQVALSVIDNGRGLPPDLDLENAPSLGLQLIRLLTEQLRGSFHVDRREGTALHVVFPYSPLGDAAVDHR
jgi:PAS domain S-box-containing protein